MLFIDIDTALRDHPDLVERHIGRPRLLGAEGFRGHDSSARPGGIFIYVPPGVEVDVPLESAILVEPNERSRCERTVVIADEGSKVHYLDGCSAPVYTSDSLRSAAIEIVVRPNAHVRYTTIQNWSNNVFNSVTALARVGAEGRFEWIDGNIGSRLTRHFPVVCLAGPKATGEVLSVAHAGRGQHHDTVATMVHGAPETTSRILSKSVASDGGRVSYRGGARVDDKGSGTTAHVWCDALVLDGAVPGDAHAGSEIDAPADAEVGDAATVSRLAEEQLFYLMSRGLSREQAVAMVVDGFVEPVIQRLPVAYAVEWSRLLGLQLEGSVG